ncbi:MAG: septum formation initiator family protein [Clostridia bacterium]|nr:hypothetical protein [Oscillospiraceae bacterium]MBR6694557.1 septum formation initiator family protein [Clostridia bacterium]
MAKRKNSVIRRVLLLAVCVYLLYSLGDLQHQLIKQRKELYEKIEERNTLKYEVEEYLNLLENGDDAELIEKAARERLGYSFSDEQIFEEAR